MSLHSSFFRVHKTDIEILKSNGGSEPKLLGRK